MKFLVIVMTNSMNNLVGIASKCLTVAPPMATVRSVTELSTIAVAMDTNVRENNVAFFPPSVVFCSPLCANYVKVAPLTAFST